jgi:hypothetical protein
MKETAKGAAQSAADDIVCAGLEKNLTALKKDVAHLSEQISEAVNALGAVAQRQARRGTRNGPANVVSLMTVAYDRAGAVPNPAQDAASSVGEPLAGVSHEPNVATPAFGLGPGSRPTAAWERSGEMEFLLMRLEGGSIMPDSIFGVLDNENRGRLPPPPGGHWSEYSTVPEHDFKFAAAAKRAITEGGYFLVGSDAIEGWGLPRPGALGRKFRPS